MKPICYDNAGFDLLAIEKINPALMAVEPDLFDTKWWDYRLLHPVQATYLFADAYIEAARMYWQQAYDYEAGLKMKPLSGWDIFNPPPIKMRKDGKGPLKKQIKGVSKAELQGLWKARQHADQRGIPYGFYCHHAIRYAKHGLWARMPRPTHLYQSQVSEGQEGFREHSMLEYIEYKWAEHKSQRTLLSEEPYYLAENNRNELNQVMHRANVMDQIKGRHEPAWGLVYALFDAPVLIEEECRRFFGNDTVDRAIQLAVD